MTEIGVHLENKIIFMLDSPFKTPDISGTQSQLPLTLHDKKTLRELLLQALHDSRRPIRRAIIDHQDMKHFLQPEHGTNDILNILLLVVCRNNDDTV